MENSQYRQSYLAESLENIPLYRARYNSKITEEQRIELILNELNLVEKEVENKQTETEWKSKLFRFLNILSTLAIISCSAIIFGLELADDCTNIGIIVMSALILITEGIQKAFRLGPLGLLYKHGNLQLKRISRQVREYMYFFNQYTPEQLLSLVSTLRAQYDDVDIGIYELSLNNTARYNNGLDIESGAPLNLESRFAQNSFPSNRSQNNIPGISPNVSQNSPQVHIHIDPSHIDNNSNLNQDNDNLNLSLPILHPNISNLTRNHRPNSNPTLKLNRTDYQKNDNSHSPHLKRSNNQSPHLKRSNNQSSNNVPIIYIESDDSPAPPISLKDQE